MWRKRPDPLGTRRATRLPPGIEFGIETQWQIDEKPPYSFVPYLFFAITASGAQLLRVPSQAKFPPHTRCGGLDGSLISF